MIKRSNFGAPYEPFSLSAKITLFAESTLQNGESGGSCFVGGGIVGGNEKSAYMKQPPFRTAVDLAVIFRCPQLCEALFSFRQKPRFLPKVPYETESRRVRSKHGGDIIRGNTNHSVYEKGCPCEQPFD